MSRIRVTAEQKRTCEVCHATGPVSLIAFGYPARQVRMCAACWDKIGRARWRVEHEGLDAVEVG